jgi:hypothetical protein
MLTESWYSIGQTDGRTAAVRLEIAVSVTIVPLSYRSRCKTPTCASLGRMILRYADAGGLPMNQSEVCLGHGQAALERDRAAGLKVYDDRELERA